MDLSTLKKNVINGHISSIEQFRVDLDQIWINACTYNIEGSEIYRNAEELREFARRELDSALQQHGMNYQTTAPTISASTSSVAPSQPVTGKRPRSISGKDPSAFVSPYDQIQANNVIVQQHQHQQQLQQQQQQQQHQHQHQQLNSPYIQMISTPQGQLQQIPMQQAQYYQQQQSMQQPIYVQQQQQPIYVQQSMQSPPTQYMQTSSMMGEEPKKKSSGRPAKKKIYSDSVDPNSLNLGMEGAPKPKKSKSSKE